MKRILVLLVLSIAFFTQANAQTIVNRAGPANTVQDWRLAAFKNLIIPRYQDTTEATNPTNLGLDSCGAIIFTRTSGKLYKRLCSPKKWEEIAGTGGAGGSFVDSVTTVGNSLYYWIGGSSTLVTDLTAAVAGGDTTIFATVLDSTGQPNNRILFSRGTKISSSPRILIDSANHRIIINGANVSVGGANTKLYVGGNAVITGQLTVQNVPQTIDTTNYKPVVIGSDGVMRKNIRWPATAGGGGGSGDTSYLYHPQSYGGLPDGTTDNTTAINAAINAASAAGGGTVYLSEGTWLIRSSYRDSATVYLPKGIKLKSNVILRGSGWGTIIKLSAPPAGATFDTTSFASNTKFFDVISGDTVTAAVVRDLTIDGNMVNQINHTHSPYTTPQNTTNYTTGIGYNVHPEKQTTTVTFTGGANNTIENVRILSSPAYGFAFLNSPTGIISKCYITDVIAGNGFYGQSQGGKFMDSKVYYSWGDNIRVQSDYITVSNNEFAYIRPNINILVASFAGVYVERVNGAKITGNFIHDASAAGIDVTDFGDNTKKGCIIDNNTVYRNRNEGILVAMSACVISNNRIYDNGADSTGTPDPLGYLGAGIAFNDAYDIGIYDNMVSNNFIDSGRGFQEYGIWNKYGNVYRSNIQGNTIIAEAGKGVPNVAAIDHTTVFGNMINGSNATGNKFAKMGIGYAYNMLQVDYLGNISATGTPSLSSMTLNSLAITGGSQTITNNWAGFTSLSLTNNNAGATTGFDLIADYAYANIALRGSSYGGYKNITPLSLAFLNGHGDIAMLADNTGTKFSVNVSGSASSQFVIKSDGSAFFLPMTATAASAISSPADGTFIYVNSTNGTFTSVGFWGRENGVWVKL